MLIRHSWGLGVSSETASTSQKQVRESCLLGGGHKKREPTDRRKDRQKDRQTDRQIANNEISVIETPVNTEERASVEEASA